MSLTAIIPVHNRRELLGRLLDTLDEQTSPAAEILVVDNGSSDGAPELALSRGARVIGMGGNTGFAAAVNRGIRESRTEWVAALNSDVELAPDYFTALLSAASESGAWFATGRLMAGRRSTDPGPGATLDGAFDLVSLGGAAWRAGSGKPFGGPFAERRKISSAPWTAAIFRSELFNRVGLLEESFESYLEDVDFGMRCAWCGLQGVYEPGAVAWHVGSATAGRWSPETVRRIARNQAWLVARHYPDALLDRMRLQINCSRILWAALAFRHGNGMAWLRGNREGRLGFATARAGRIAWQANVLETLLRENERIIHSIQSLTGFDWYWKMYFLLTRGEAK